MRMYQAVRENMDVFHDFFRCHLLLVQVWHGARLVGRWETDDGRVVAVWEYDDRAAYERIEAAVRRDPESLRAREHRAALPPLTQSTEEVFMSDTVPGPRPSGGTRPAAGENRHLQAGGTA